MATREQQKSAYRQRILDAAQRIFLSHGYHDATTRQIAKEAGVGVGTVFNHFPTKSDILFAVYASLLTGEYQPIAFQSDDTLSVYDHIEYFFQQYLDRTRHVSKEWLRVLYAAIYRPPTTGEPLYSSMLLIDQTIIQDFAAYLRQMRDHQLIHDATDIDAAVEIIYAVLMQNYSAYALLEDLAFEQFRDQLRRQLDYLIQHILLHPNPSANS